MAITFGNRPSRVAPRITTMIYALVGRWIVVDPILGPERVLMVKLEKLHVDGTNVPNETVLRIQLWSPQTETFRMIFRASHEPCTVVADLDAS